MGDGGRLTGELKADVVEKLGVWREGGIVYERLEMSM